MAPGLSWPPIRVSPVPGAGVGTPFAGWGDRAGEAGGRFVESLFELPAGGVGSAGLGAGTLCGGGCWFVCGSFAKSSGTGTPCVLTTGSFLVTSNVLFSGATSSAGFSPLAFADVFREFESPSESDAPSEPESPCESDSPSEIELPRKFAVSTEPESSSGWSIAKGIAPGLPFKDNTLVVPVLGTSVNATGTPNVLTGHGGGGVMKVGWGLGCPGKIVVV